MKPHLRYLRYVLLHKLYVALGGLAIGRVMGAAYERSWSYWLRLVTRLVVHDLSKFRPSEWRPYVASFYGDQRFAVQAELDRLLAAARAAGAPGIDAESFGKAAEANVRANVRRAFDAAWLAHQHRNDHHWQHWVLREDSGKTKILLPPSIVVDEMLADWLGAGTKILRWPEMAECVGETIVWYTANKGQMQLREAARQRIEETLYALAAHYGLADMAAQVHAAEYARASVQVNL